MSGVRDSIGWCTHTTNAVTGCLGPNGTSCAYCYAMRFRKRLAGVPGTVQHALRQAGLDINAPAISRYRLSLLDLELERARKPRRVFVGSMGDLGYDGPYLEVTAEGRASAGHTIGSHVVRLLVATLFERHPRHTFLLLSKQPRGLLDVDWPDNAHVGVSVTGTRPVELDRIRVLAEVQCGLRWASVEPLQSHDFDGRALKGLGWVAVGVETGPGVHRPKVAAPTAWRIVEWCRDVYHIPVYIKNNLRDVPGYDWPTELP